MTAFAALVAVQVVFLNDRNGSIPAAEEIKKLPFGEISWPMSGNGIIADVVS